MTRGLADKVAIVTGASRGIGLSVAERLTAEGARVCITARNQGELEAAARSLADTDHVIAVAGKADDPQHQADAVRRTEAAFGPIDILVNNAGINPTFGPMIELDLNAARKIVEVNCLAALSWIQHVYRSSMRERGGAVVNVSSVAGIRPAPGIGFYGASKAMLAHLTAELALELSPGVRVNAVAPAVVKTTFAEALYDEKEEKVADTYPLKRLGLPPDVADAVTYLLSEQAAWITGQTLVVDGGLTLTGGV